MRIDGDPGIRRDAVEDANRRCILKTERERIGQAGEHVQPGFSKLPTQECGQRECRAVFWLAWRTVIERVVGVVSADQRPIASGACFHHLARKRSAVDAVAGDNNVIDVKLHHIIDDGLQGGEVAMDVGEDCQSGHIRFSFRRS